ncbi:MAG: hypothetical protein EHM87_07395 [Burkholderiales bacterium]|nr:MAG: hypothetical protein EHM87_07395 [Burkholderiales bacterium]
MSALPRDAAPAETLAGRVCPIEYRYAPSALRAAPELQADVLWVVGGLYGNLEALRTIARCVEAERASRVEVVLNGDFHWFDADAPTFAQIQAGVAGWRPMRGNVETELARPDGDGADAGCGCAYPDSVPQEDVDRSNAMMVRLRATARALDAGAALGALPMLGRARVGSLRVGLVHGDDRSLAGWRLAHDALDASRADGLDAAFDDAQVDLIASSHTCMPVADAWTSSRHGRTLAVINNGAAGMANFAGSTHGIATRIAAPGAPMPAGLRVLYRATLGDTEVAAVAVDFDVGRFLEGFDRTWPAGSPAERSYRARIAGGTACAPRAAVRGPFGVPS